MAGEESNNVVDIGVGKTAAERVSELEAQFNAEKSRRIAYGYIDFQLQAVAL